MKTLRGILRLTGIALLLSIATGLKAQCNLTATSTHTNVSCYGGENGTIIVNAAGGTGHLSYGVGGTGVIMPPQPFNSNVLTADTSANDWYAPGGTLAIAYHNAGGCPGGMVGYTGRNTNYWFEFIRTPGQNCTGNNSVVLSFDISNGYNPSHVTYNTSNHDSLYTGDGMYFDMWTTTKIYTTGGFVQASSVKINGTEVGFLDVNGYWLRFDTLRSCAHIEVTFPLVAGTLGDGSGRIDTITDLSNIRFYLNALNQFNDSVLFNFSLDNIGVTGSTPSSWQSSDTIGDLTAGIHQIYAQDSLGCSVSVTDTITQPSAIVITVNQSDSGSCNGIATAGVTGGIPPYIVTWSDAANQVGLTETRICKDSIYYVTVTDSFGCMVFDTIKGSGLDVVINTTPSVNCYGLICNGTANAQVTGGNPPYTYKWSNGQTTDGIANLCIGTGTLTVKDAFGDSVVKAFTIDTTPQISINVTTQPNSGCSGVCNGTVSVTFINKGDGGPYKFKWSDEVPLTTTGSRTGLCAGSYTVSAIDLGPCYSDTVVANFTINQSSSLSETLTTYSSCSGANSGSIIVNPINGTGVLLYSINPGQTIGMETFDSSGSLVTGDTTVYSAWYSPGTCTGGGMTWDSTGGCSGSGAAGYTASPGTGNGCYLRSPLLNCSGLGKVTMTLDLTNTASSFGDSIWFYVWSQTNDKYYPSCIGTGCGTIIDSINGVATSNISLAATRTCQTMTVLFDLSSIPSADREALYFYLQPKFKEAAGYSFNLLFDNITLSAASAINLWQTGNTFTNLSPGEYAVSIMDTSGCYASLADTVVSAGNFTVTASSNSPVCAGDTIKLSVTPSAGSVAFNWSGPVELATFSLANADVPEAQLYDAGTYTVSVVSDSGCLATASVDVAVDQILDTVSGNNATCDGICNGNVKVANVYQGIAPFTYSWNSDAYSSATGDSTLCAGTYHVIIQDSIGCTKVDSVTITNLSNSCDVWPGDANDDGVVNNYDILEIGLGYGYTGPVRDSASLVWVGQPALDWDSILPPGINAKFADCDGNGIVDADDTLAVTLNYGLSHPKNGAPQSNSGPLLYIQLPPEDSIEAGQPIQVPIYLGTEGIPVSIIGGLAFSINYNSSLVDSTVQLSASNSWMGTPGVNLLTFRENFYSSGVTDIALTRTDHTNVSGFGSLCTLTYVMKDDISGKSEISQILPFTISDVTAITSKGVIVPLSFGAIDTVIAYQYTGISNISLSNALRVYPNPAGQYIVADAGKVMVDQYIITDLLGIELKIIDVKQQGPLSIDVSQLNPGLYFLRARSGDEKATLKFSVVR